MCVYLCVRASCVFVFVCVEGERDRHTESEERAEEAVVAQTHGRPEALGERVCVCVCVSVSVSVCLYVCVCVLRAFYHILYGGGEQAYEVTLVCAHTCIIHTCMYNT